MNFNYKKLWKMLIDRDLKKQDLGRLANISASTISKLGRNENVTVDVLVKISVALSCGLDDIVEIEYQSKT
jgi:DNA-binding Xre family transcriptional regulator